MTRYQSFTDWRHRQQENQLIALAPSIHEAGHVFAARYFDLRVAWVSIDSDFVKGRQSPTEVDHSEGYPTTMTIASEHLNTLYNRKSVISRDEWAWVRGYCIQCLAGPISEEIFNPYFEVEVGGHDYAQAFGLIHRVMGHAKSKARTLRMKYTKEACDFTQTNKNAIFYLGVEIHNRGTLMQDDIDPAILRAKRLAEAIVLKAA
jgi:hypothetical protein